MKIILDFPYKKIKKRSKKGGAHLHRKKYLKTCHELCDPTSSKETCKRNTVIILQELQKYVYPAINKEKKEIFIKIFGFLKHDIDLVDENYLSLINLLSLQCSILLVDESKLVADPLYMLYIRPDIFFTDSYELLKSIEWDTYSVLKEAIKTNTVLKSLFNNLIHDPLKQYPTEYSFPLQPESVVFLAVCLGEMTLSELIMGNVKQIYFLGIVLTESNADGYTYNPLTFFYHDIDHSKGDLRRYIGRNRTKNYVLNITLQQFINHIIESKIDGYLNENQYNYIFFWLFWILHESDIGTGVLIRANPSEHGKIEMIEILLNSVVVYRTRGNYLERFLDENDLRGFVPDSLQPNLRHCAGDGLFPIIDYSSLNPRSFFLNDRVPAFFKDSATEFVDQYTLFISLLEMPSNIFKKILDSVKKKQVSRGGKKTRKYKHKNKNKQTNKIYNN
jgi:hypothetical protein